MITPAEFIAKWGPNGSAAHLNEEQGAQSHFLDLCELLDAPKQAHAALDAAAYGWSDDAPDLPDTEILRRLLALNLERAAVQVK